MLQDSLGTERWAVVAQAVTCRGSVHPSGLCKSELCPGAGPGTLVAAAPCVASLRNQHIHQQTAGQCHTPPLEPLNVKLENASELTVSNPTVPGLTQLPLPHLWSFLFLPGHGEITTGGDLRHSCVVSPSSVTSPAWLPARGQSLSWTPECQPGCEQSRGSSRVGQGPFPGPHKAPFSLFHQD